jgi:hypothetical protein
MLIAHPIPGKGKSSMLCAAFIDGAPKSAKGHVFYGTLGEPLRIYRQALLKGEPCWLIDNSYFDSVRGQQFRVTLNTLQVMGARNRESDGKRFDALGLEIKVGTPEPPGFSVVVCRQSEAFMRDIACDPYWIEKALETLDPIRTRERPWLRDKAAQQSTLVEDLRGAAGLLTHSSAAAVTALLECVPIITSEMSAVHGCNLDLGTRRHFMNVLADNQFTLNELKDGTAWRLLNR